MPGSPKTKARRTAKSAPGGATRKGTKNQSPTRAATGSPRAKRKSAKNKGRKSAKNKPPEPVVDLKSPEAMLNAYYICHSAVDFLHYRGFEWLGGSTKKKKKGKSKKK